MPLSFVDPAVGVILGGCGLVLILRRRRSLVGPLLLLGCGCWFLGSIWSVALFLHRGPLIQVHISYPTGRIRRPLAVVTVLGAYLVSIVEATASNPWVTLGMAALVAAAAADIYARTSGPARKAGGPALGAALTFASVLALSAANQLLLWQSDRLVALVYDLAICVVALVLTSDLLWGRWTEATVADFVTQLGCRTDAGNLTLAIRRTLGDPTATIGFWFPEQGRYLDDRGAPFDPPADDPHRIVVRIDDGGVRAAILVRDAAASPDPQLITDVTAALRIAIGNTRLRANVRANMVELNRARRRLVEASDAEQRRWETELAEGPERRLSELARLLEQAETQAGPDVQARIQEAQAEVSLVGADLVTLAEGIRPAVLESGGLAAAIPELVARTSSIQVSLQVTSMRLPPAVESAVHFICAEALVNVTKHAHAGAASVDITADETQVVARISDDGRGGADPEGLGLRGLRDRVEALGGTLTISGTPTIDGQHPTGTVLAARIPLGEAS
ncbi:putative two-component system histidine kinase [Microlunatus phosphovorus NM-1]|uniref:Putative two-component system histidine kinase n=1 Tax=Microlunatus phosphovorus (strain ATCC 700054 / DSM 10555 / JCM 9379 / NBRC 101784 / NCIMB 13414 / VKM Ac-1990 / NM-1) TaxID=1032480 RepID=F5XGI0_MICPN|nr:ATP-binding protein [Microlunatus phosphovorus]BAK33087.1 putative two-component system histidine kinase [Microlunatus phosphovorus NM-1]